MTLYEHDQNFLAELRASLVEERRRDPDNWSQEEIDGIPSYDPCGAVDLLGPDATYIIVNDQGDRVVISHENAYTLAKLGLSKHVIVEPG